jgi:hypothetical protein
VAMYFFDIHDGHTLLPDDDGYDLPNLKAAMREATLSARDLRLQVGRGVFFASHAPCIEVLDEDGKRVLALPMYANGLH